ncbi:uncharacterized protein LOC108740863 [Agrilus planipennis]|uniref:Uncharacterized protein LOC108740863 n=1 Tax=Agrilus planipennis TaxID=224129 RepID=A0A1W4XEI8_AGRPL|nr:uncharacterized protein LOC108740863 [Agrilus planipennis]
MFKQILTIALLALITYCYSQQYTSPGQCADRRVRPVRNLQFERYGATGRRWYTVFTHNTAGDCQYINLTLTSNVTVDFFWVVKNLTTNTWNGRPDGVITWIPPCGTRDAILSTDYANATSSIIFSIFGIDYDGYMLQYRCVDLNSTTRTETIYGRSRNTTFTPQQAAKVQKIISDNGLADLPLTYAVQDPALCST